MPTWHIIGIILIAEGAAMWMSPGLRMVNWLGLATLVAGSLILGAKE